MFKQKSKPVIDPNNKGEDCFAIVVQSNNVFGNYISYNISRLKQILERYRILDENLEVQIIYEGVNRYKCLEKIDDAIIKLNESKNVDLINLLSK